MKILELVDPLVAKKRADLKRKLKSGRKDPKPDVQGDNPDAIARPDDWRGQDWSGSGSQ